MGPHIIVRLAEHDLRPVDHLRVLFSVPPSIEAAYGSVGGALGRPRTATCARLCAALPHTNVPIMHKGIRGVRHCK